MFQSKLLIACIIAILLITSVYEQSGSGIVYAIKKGSHHSAESKQKISESSKKYHATGKMKKHGG